MSLICIGVFIVNMLNWWILWNFVVSVVGVVM